MCCATRSRSAFKPNFMSLFLRPRSRVLFGVRNASIRMSSKINPRRYGKCPLRSIRTISSCHSTFSKVATRMLRTRVYLQIHGIGSSISCKLLVSALVPRHIVTPPVLRPPDCPPPGGSTHASTACPRMLKSLRNNGVATFAFVRLQSKEANVEDVGNFSHQVCL